MRKITAVGIFVCVLALLAGSFEPVQAQTAPIFIALVGDSDPAALDVRRQSRIRIDRPDLLLDEAGSVRLHVELFSNVSFHVVRTGPLEKTPDGVVWIGIIEDVPDSAVRFELAGGKVSGHIFGTIGIYRVQEIGNSYAVQELILAGEGTETNRFSIIPFLEGTDVFWTIAKGNTFAEIVPNKLEANIFPHLVVAQTFTDVLSVDKQERRGLEGLREFSYSFSGTPAVRIRMLRLTSAPVRTPSFMPRGNFQFFWVRGLKDCDPLAAARKSHCPQTPDASTRAIASQSRVAQARLALLALPRITVWEAHAIIGHHSNGQAGCLNSLEQRVPPETGDCVPPTPLTAENINYKDGSFSTNYFRVGLNWSRHRLRGPEAVLETRILGELEQHPRAWVDDRMVDLYGRTRVNLAFSEAWRDMKVCRKRSEASIASTLIFNPREVEEETRHSFTAQFSCFPTTNGGWGMFVRFYTGQDYYNVGFLNNITRVHAGMTFNQSGFFRFRRSSNP